METNELARLRAALEQVDAAVADSENTYGSSLWTTGAGHILRPAVEHMREALSTPPAPAAEPHDAQYRCLWEECMGSIDGPLWIPFSGRVHDSIESCLTEWANRMADPKFRGTHIEARLKSAGPWPRPWDASSRSVEPPSASEADRTPKGYRRIEAYTNDKEIVAMEWPKDGDETHNCDAMGCSSVEHVKYRAEIPGWQLGQDQAAPPDEAAIRADQRRKVCDEIQSIMREYRRQQESGNVDTPGGLEHMGDVWRLLAKWDAAIERGEDKR